MLYQKTSQNQSSQYLLDGLGFEKYGYYPFGSTNGRV